MHYIYHFVKILRLWSHSEVKKWLCLVPVALSWIFMITFNYAIVLFFSMGLLHCSVYIVNDAHWIQYFTSRAMCTPSLQDTVQTRRWVQKYSFPFGMTINSKYSWNATQVLIILAMLLWDKRMVCSLTTGNQGRQIIGKASANFGYLMWDA